MESVFDTGRLLVISPHLDDAVLSCGMLLSAAEKPCVVTVFTGYPQEAARLTDWDRGCGFTVGVEAMRARLEEDAHALRLLDSEVRHLGFLDSQYAPLPTSARLSLALMQTIHAVQPDVVCMPLGLHHCDHERVHEAALRAMVGDAGHRLWIGYEDALYRRRYGVLQNRLARLAKQKLIATPVQSNAGASETLARRAAHAAAKAQALKAYKSQLASLRLISGMGDCAAPERYWLLDPGAVIAARNKKNAP
jgi:LmbE family N-acetylglucosaminyl deacetylase